MRRQRGEGRKITLGQARAQQDVIVHFYCHASGPDVRSGRCWHSASAPIERIIARFGEGMRLDEIPARCSRCGRRDAIDVRTSQPYRKSEELQDLIYGAIDKHRPSNDNQ